MKSAKSRVDSVFWVSRGAPGDFAIVCLERWVSVFGFSNVGGKVGSGAGLDLSPSRPLSDTIERLVEGRVASVGGGPDVRMKSASSAVPVWPWEYRGESGDWKC